MLPGALMAMNGVGFIVRPAETAASLGMPYLEGVARSTQIGDMASFFLGCGIMCVLGAWQRRATWLYAAALLLGGTAVFRTLATVLHEAPFTTVFIIVEVVSASLLIFCGSRMARAQ